jgi:O-antigen/teichoic acid export membrane protein
VSPGVASRSAAPSAVLAPPAGTPQPPPGAPASRRGPGLRRGAMFLAGGQAVAMALGIVGGILLVRVADQHAVASYLLLARAAAVVAILFQLGLVPAVLRFAPLSRGVGGGVTMTRLRRRVLGIQVAAWLLLVPIVMAGWPGAARRLGAPELVGSAWLLALAAIAFAFSAVADAYLRSARRYATSALVSQVLVRGVWVACLLAFLLRGPSTSWSLLAGAFLAAQLAAVGACALALRLTREDDGGGPLIAEPPPTTGRLLDTVWVMALNGVVAALLVSIDLWALAWARPHAEVAVYGVMLSALQGMVVLPGVVLLVIPQEFAALHRQGRLAELERLVRGAATVVSALSMVVFVGLVLFGKPALRVAFGDAYAGGWSILLILAAGRVWHAWSGAAGYLLQMTGHHRALLLATLGAAAVTLLLALGLAPRWGGHGAAVAATCGLVFLNVVTASLARRRLGVRSWAFAPSRRWLGVLRQAAPWGRR